MMNSFRDGHWLGEVIDNKDPLKNGRCKVKVYGTFDNIAIDTMPWASPGNRSSVGQHLIPNIGDIVSIIFDNGNIYAPVYSYQINQNKTLKKDILDASSKPQDVVCLIYDEVRNVRIYHSPEDGLVITRGSGIKERPIIQLDEKGIIKISSDDKIFLDAGNVYLSNTGEDSEDTSEPAVRGKSLESFLEKFKSDYNSHIHPTPSGPSGTPVKPWVPIHKPYQQEGK